jgi:hypothetical protein
VGLLAEAPHGGVLAEPAPESYATTLDLYADALLRVLDHAEKISGGGTAGDADLAGGGGEDPIVRVVRHERRLVARTLAGAAAATSGHQRDLAVTVAFLRRAAGIDAAAQALLKGMEEKSIEFKKRGSEIYL